ncbi:MAG: DUF2520 domain-containing protein [Chitinophagaceae bacterium]|nr:MAG: DUF2520 domain-containing protein [Chitinophagaceae bacterium]
MRIVIIGSGNVATVLGRRIYLAGHTIVQVYSRNGAGAAKLARELEASPCIEPVAVDLTADLYLIAVSDSAISTIAGWLRVQDKIVAHTAGSVSMAALSPCSSSIGVIYPLQTIRKEADMVQDIPILVDGNHDEAKTALFDLANDVSGTVQFADDNKRSHLHTAAVVVNNFSNYLYTLAADYCENENLDFRLLTPLIAETAERIKVQLPKDVQTGPAVRNDVKTIDEHLQKLANYPDLAELYRLFTKKIISYYSENVVFPAAKNNNGMHLR